MDIERGMKKRGYIRMQGPTNDILAAHYTIKECSDQEFIPNTGTDMNFVYDNEFIAFYQKAVFFFGLRGP